MDAPIGQALAKLNRQRTAPLILELDLTEGVAQTRPAEPLAAFASRHQPTLPDILTGLREAASDDRVLALVAKLGGRPIGLATTQEVRGAIGRFRESGKPAIAWAETFGEFSAGNVPYYLATAFDQIFLQPSGDVGLTGLAVERIFLRGALDRLGVSFDVGARHEYKNAAEQLTSSSFSAPSREAAEHLTGALAAQLAEAIAERASIPEEEATALLNGGPYLAGEALAKGLVDALGYRDEVYAAVRERAGAGTEAVLLYLGRYQRLRDLADRARRMVTPRPQVVAMITANGGIRRGRSGRSPLTGSAIGSDTLTAALRAATAYPRVRAILLRVNSPGGSYVASDAVWREVVRTRNAGKPVVVSMGDVAASGGYYISMAADAIFVQPGTITGSIGVVTAKPAIGDMLAKAGITSDSVVLGGHATMFSALHPFTAAEWELVDAWLDHIYADFTGKVAAARRMSAGRVHEIARGRVWSGADALENGLADELGGLEAAAAAARARAGLPADSPVVSFPRISALERIRPAASSEDRRAAAGLGARAEIAGAATGTAASLVAAGLATIAAESWGPLWRLALDAGLPATGPLLLPGAWVIS